MQNAVFMFSGQGSLLPGAGRRLYATMRLFKDTIDECAEQCQENLPAIIWGGQRACRQNDPYYDHIATFATSLGLCRCLTSAGFKPDLMMGHSLGEICATICAGALSLEDGIALIRKRGSLFRSNRRKNRAEIIALIGQKDKIDRSINTFKTEHEIYPVNYNTHDQVVVAVENLNLPSLRKLCLSNRVRTVPLNVGNGCHCRFVAEIDPPLRDMINKIEFRDPQVPVFSSNTITCMRDHEEIKSNMLRHLLSPVNWLRSIRTVGQQAERCFIEAGLSKILLGLVRRIDRSYNAFSGYSLLN